MHLASRAVARSTKASARFVRTCPAAATSNRSCGWPRCCTTWATDHWAFFRRALSGRLRPEPRNPRRRNHQPQLAACSAASAAIPTRRLADGETLDPEQIVFLITRPKAVRRRPALAPLPAQPFSGLYTVDNMDFVLRDAYMSGYSSQAFDLERLLHYSFFTARPDDPRAGAFGPGAVYLRPGRTVSGDLFPPHGPRDRPRASGIVLRQQAASVPGDPREYLERVPAVDRVVAAGARCRAGRRAASRNCGSWASGGANSSAAGCGGRWPASGPSFLPPAKRAGSVLSNAAAFETASGRVPPELKRLAVEVDTARHVHVPGPRRRPPARTSFSIRPPARSAASTSASYSAGSPSASASAASMPSTTPPSRVGRRPGPSDRRGRGGRRDEM